MASDNGEGAAEGTPDGSLVETVVHGNGHDTVSVRGTTVADRKGSEEASPVAGEPLYVQAAYEYLGRKHCQLWAQFTIFSHNDRLRAARWLAEEVAGVEKVLTSGWGPE